MQPRYAAILWLFLACSPDDGLTASAETTSTTTATGTGVPTTGEPASTGDAASTGDSGTTGEPSTTGTTGGDPPPAQACDPGDTDTCNNLASSWASGTATCADDGTRWDVSGCQRAVSGSGDTRYGENVYPAQRDPERWGAARCSYEGDFYFEVSLSPSHSNVWQINLEGGGQCNSAETCADRKLAFVAPFLPSGNGFVAAAPDGTLGAAPGNQYAIAAIEGDANLVKANYCSNDLWTGSKDLSDFEVPFHDPRTDEIVTRPWHFNGRQNIRAMLEILRERYGFDDSSATLKVHLRGQSAGGVGASNNAWVVAQYAPNAAADHRIMVSSWHGYAAPDWDPGDYNLSKPDDFWFGGVVGTTGQEA